MIFSTAVAVLMSSTLYPNGALGYHGGVTNQPLNLLGHISHVPNSDSYRSSFQNRVLQQSVSDCTWTQLGQDIVGEAGGDWSSHPGEPFGTKQSPTVISHGPKDRWSPNASSSLSIRLESLAGNGRHPPVRSPRWKALSCVTKDRSKASP